MAITNVDFSVALILHPFGCYADHRRIVNSRLHLLHFHTSQGESNSCSSCVWNARHHARRTARFVVDTSLTMFSVFMFVIQNTLKLSHDSNQTCGKIYFLVWSDRILILKFSNCRYCVCYGIWCVFINVVI